MRGTTLHDTYYVVAHVHYALGLLAATLAVCAIWWVILRLSAPPPKRLACTVIAAQALGACMTLAPSLILGTAIPGVLRNGGDPGAIARWFGIANGVSTTGAAISSMAVLATVAMLGLTLYRWLVRRP